GAGLSAAERLLKRNQVRVSCSGFFQHGKNSSRRMGGPHPAQCYHAKNELRPGNRDREEGGRTIGETGSAIPISRGAGGGETGRFSGDGGRSGMRTADREDVRRSFSGRRNFR